MKEEGGEREREQAIWAIERDSLPDREQAIEREKKREKWRQRKGGKNEIEKERKTFLLPPLLAT